MYIMCAKSDQCKPLIQVPLVLPLFHTLVPVVAQYYINFRHYLYEQKLASLVWKIEYKDLLMPAVDQDPTYSEKTKVR